MVVVAGSVLAVHLHQLHALRVKSVRASGPPTTGRKGPRSHYRARDFDGINAPWALSALPECWLQQRVWRGRRVEDVAKHIPAGAQRLPAGTRIELRDCRLTVRADDALVARGADRFHIPPEAKFYAAGSRLVLLRFDHGGDLRVYAPSTL
ncbi:MAG: hypothetical protein DLM50_04240 [Candidatus Meridianibacter frigidus]|nr:MAG: hypothetical protein DLM50_04240 [Candidatus Eremiobacteraeota bacterium]